MHTLAKFAKDKSMKLSTKILIGLFVATLIPSIYLGQFVLAGIKPTANGFTFNFDVWGWVGIGVMVVNLIIGNILFFRFLRTQSLAKVLFFSTAPLSVFYGVGLYLLADVSRYNNATAVSVRKVLNISTTNTYNTVLWAVILSLGYIVLVFILYYFICRPMTRIEKILNRLGDGRVNQEHFTIGKSKQFKNVEHSLNKINYNYMEKENKIKETNLEAQKFIPKQFFKFLGKSNIADLELGNQVKKMATTLFCDLTSTAEISQSLSLEENFNFINSYLNVVSPIIRRYGGFVDKYLGDGILAVFARPENAIDCAHNIIRSIEVKNKSQRDLPPVDAKISIHTGEVIFGIVGDEERKSPTIVSDVVNLASKMEDLNKYLHTKMIFSKSVLSEVPSRFKFAYRYLGSLKLDEGNNLALFESLEVYPRDRREKLANLKGKFENAVRYYNDARYDEAARDFEEILKLLPEDKPSYIYYNKAKEKAEQ